MPGIERTKSKCCVDFHQNGHQTKGKVFGKEMAYTMGLARGFEAESNRRDYFAGGVLTLFESQA